MPAVLGPVCCALLVLWIARAIHRLYFHPLARYPGSKVAALSTDWYEWYWNVHQPGQLLFEIERLHKAHGPVVRIGVNELHVNDPDVFFDITKVGSKFSKDEAFYRGISLPHTSIGGVNPSEHRIRRQVLGPAFSRARVQELAPLAQKHIDTLVDKLSAFAESDSPVNITRAFKSLTLDIISKIVFGDEFGVLETPDFHHPQLDVLHKVVEQAWIFRAFPTICALSLSLPTSVATTLFPIPIDEFAKVTKFFLMFEKLNIAKMTHQQCKARIDTYLKNRERGIIQSTSNTSINMKPSDGRRNQRDVSVILELLLNPAAAPGHKRLTAKELNDEALMLLTAGNDTTSNAMILGLYNICRHPDVQDRLRKELHDSLPANKDEVLLEDVQKLPYLTATIKEVLRFTSPIPGRLPRVVPAEGYSLYGHRLDPGTVIHCSAFLLNRMQSVWGPDANEFKPERWLAPGSAELEKYMVSFQRGTRQCLGLDLAWCELRLLFATLFRKFDLKIFETTDADMEWSDHLLMLFKGRDFHVKLSLPKAQTE